MIACTPTPSATTTSTRSTPPSGAVTGVVDAASLYPEANTASGNVLNGIAYDPDSGHFYVTGKRWPTLYEVIFEPAG